MAGRPRMARPGPRPASLAPHMPGQTGRQSEQPSDYSLTSGVSGSVVTGLLLRTAVQPVPDSCWCHSTSVQHCRPAPQSGPHCTPTLSGRSDVTPEAALTFPIQSNQQANRDIFIQPLNKQKITLPFRSKSTISAYFRLCQVNIA